MQNIDETHNVLPKAALNSEGSMSLLCTAEHIRAINRIDRAILITLLSYEIVFKVEEETVHRNNSDDLDG